MEQVYYPVSATKEVSQVPVVAKTRGGILHIPNGVIMVKPLPPKEGFSVIAKIDFSGTEYILDYRGKKIYSTIDLTQSMIIEELGDIGNGWTFNKPTTEFDTWYEGVWVTDEQAIFEAKIINIDNVRRSFYSSMSDPLISEATIERLQGNENKAIELENQAIAAREKIRSENPWPTKD
tara:strand:+ start:19364 stop:19897 length:534 start_codon:yes stop_codon:yes gene_type:complete